MTQPTYLRLTRSRRTDGRGLELLRLDYLRQPFRSPDSGNSSPVSLQTVIQAYKGLPHQSAALPVLEADLKANPYDVVMRRDREWYQIWKSAPMMPEVIGSMMVVSGAPGAQHFRTAAASRSGSLEPLPEGLWRVENIEWASRRVDDWSGSWGAGLGPVSIPLTYQRPGTTQRQAIEIHIDWNERIAPGTAGCIGVKNRPDMERLIGWLRETDPRRLFVDWELGTCPTP